MRFFKSEKVERPPISVGRVSVCGRRYLRGRKFGITHAGVYRAVDFFAELIWYKKASCCFRGSASLQRTIVIKPDHIGDLLMATPFLAAIRDHQREYGGSLKLVTGRWNAACAELLERIGVCDSVDFVDWPFLAAPRVTFQQCGKFIKDVMRVGKALRQWKPTLAIDLRPFAPNGIPLALLSRADCCAGFGTRGFSKLLDIEFPYDSEVPTGQLFLNGLEALGVSHWSRQQYVGPELVGVNRASTSDPLRRFGLTQGSYYVLHLESRESVRTVDYSSWKRVIDSLERGHSQKTIVLVGSGSSELARMVCQHMAAAGLPFVSTAGQTNFEELVLLCQGSAGALCIDSVAAHLAISARRPALVLMVNDISFRSSYPLPIANLPLFFATANQRGSESLDAAVKSFLSAVARSE